MATRDVDDSPELRRLLEVRTALHQIRPLTLSARNTDSVSQSEALLHPDRCICTAIEGAADGQADGQQANKCVLGQMHHHGQHPGEQAQPWRSRLIA
jgi:hypothetical protein